LLDALVVVAGEVLVKLTIIPDGARDNKGLVE